MNSVYIVFEKYITPIGVFPEKSITVDSVFSTSTEADQRVVQMSQKMKNLNERCTAYFNEKWDVMQFKDMK